MHLFRSITPAVDEQFHDRPLATGEKLLPGARLMSPRRGYIHHGIYVGGGRVVHYDGRAWGLLGGRVEEVPVARFTRGQGIRVRQAPQPSAFAAQEVIRRARSRLGEERYRLLANNCEHFCEWCLHGRACSYQVERLLASWRSLTRIPRLLTAGNVNRSQNCAVGA
jgi:cell wall-associated NlpC family hydrolase